jgi:hypothetical protein
MPYRVRFKALNSATDGATICKKKKKLINDSSPICTSPGIEFKEIN